MPFVDAPAATPAPKRGFVDDPPAAAPQGGFVDDPPTQPPGVPPLPTKPSPTQFHPNSAIRATPSPHVHGQNQAQQFFGKAAQTALDVSTGVQQATAHGINDTLAALDAFLGAPGRALQGAIASPDANPVHIVQNAIDNTVQPFDKAKVGQNLDIVMKRLGVNNIENFVDQHVSGDKKPLVHSLLSLGTSLIVDPLLFAGPVAKLGKAADIAGYAKQAMSGIQQVVPGSKALVPIVNSIQTTGKDIVRSGAKIFGRRPELDKYLTGDVGKPARMGIENKITNNFVRPQQAKDEALLEQHKRVMKGQGLNVDPLKQRVLEDAFVYGNTTMRAQAMNLGYEQLTKKLHGNDYFNRQVNTKPFGTSKYDVHNRMQDLQNELTAQGADEYAVWKQALDQSRDKTYEGLVNKETQDFLANHGGIQGFDWHKATQAARDKQAKAVVDSLTFGPKKVELGGALDKVAGIARGMGRNSVMLDPLPHGLRNVGMLAYLSGGPVAFGKGLAYAFKGLDGAQMARMSNLGLHADYISSIKGPIGISTLGKWDSNLLNRLELGYRQALYEHYDLFLPKAVPGHELARDYQIADHIHRDLGDYRNVSAFVSALQAVGGPFVAFRVGTVPSAVGRSIRARPWLPESIEKLQQGPLTDRDDNTEVVLGGPTKDASDAYFDGLRYGASPATTGPVIGNVATTMLDARNPHGQSPQSMLEKAAIDAIPGASLGMNAINAGAQELSNVTHGKYGSQDGIFQPYGGTTLQGPHSLLLEMLLQVFGLHTQRPLSEKAAARNDKTIYRQSQQ